MKFTEYQKGVLSMVGYALLASFMGVLVRYMSGEFSTFQQVFLRSGIGFVFGLILFSRYYNFSKLKSIPRKDLYLFLLRASSLLVGVALYTLSVKYAKLVNVSVISSVPTTVLLGVVLLKEKLGVKELLLIIGSFVGVLLVSFNSDFGGFGLGEILAFISTFFYSLSIITRKWMSPHFSSLELASIGTFLVTVLAFLVSTFVATEPVINYIGVSFGIWGIVLLAGLAFILLGVCMNVGMRVLQASVVSNLMTLQVVFSAIMGLVVFGETMVLREIVGAALITFCAIMISKFRADGSNK